MSPTWEGLYCALWTPTNQAGELDESALRFNLGFLQNRGLHGLLVLGSTGEFPHLDIEKRKRVMQQVAALADPLRVIINISDLRPRVVADLGAFARDSGASAVTLLPPWFYPIAQEDLVEFFVRGAEAARLPLFLYNFPERTGNRINLDTIAAVADRVPLAGVKQSGSEFGYHTELAKLGRQKGFVVLTGSDTRLREAMALGASGCVSGLANAVPDLLAQSWLETRNGSVLEHSAAEKLAELGRRIQTVNFPLDVAACMEARGLQVGATKSVVSAATADRYTRLVMDLRSLFQDWKLQTAVQ